MVKNERMIFAVLGVAGNRLPVAGDDPADIDEVHLAAVESVGRVDADECPAVACPRVGVAPPFAAVASGRVEVAQVDLLVR